MRALVGSIGRFGWNKAQAKSRKGRPQGLTQPFAAGFAPQTYTKKSEKDDRQTCWQASTDYGSEWLHRRASLPSTATRGIGGSRGLSFATSPRGRCSSL